jgi:hypothetical protein
MKNATKKSIEAFFIGYIKNIPSWAYWSWGLMENLIISLYLNNLKMFSPVWKQFIFLEHVQTKLCQIQYFSTTNFLFNNSKSFTSCEIKIASSNVNIVPLSS